MTKTALKVTSAAPQGHGHDHGHDPTPNLQRGLGQGPRHGHPPIQSQGRF